MSRHTWTVTGLVVALLGSNLWWASQVLDAGITRTYQQASLDGSQQLLAQTMVVLPVVANVPASRDAVIAAARSPGPIGEPFEKAGFVWVGQLGLRFDDRGRLIAVSTGEVTSTP